MPIETKDCDRGNGNIIVIRGVVTDKELMDTFKIHLTQNKEKLKKYKWHISKAASISGLNRSTFNGRLKKLGDSF